MNPRWFYLLLAVEALVLATVRWPHLMSLADFAHGDPGAVLALAQLTASGARPGVDFTYLYGLGTVVFGDAVFGIFGISPEVYVGSSVCLAAVLAVTVGWAAVGSGARGPGYALVAAGLVAGLPIPAVNYVHLLEPILLSVAVGLYSRDRPGTALAVVTGAVFAKPALAYVCGLLLVLDGLGAAMIDRSRAPAVLVSRFLPAIGVGIVLITALAMRYGLTSLLTTLFPVAGLSVFEAEEFGFFFGRGQDFWKPPGAKWSFYVGTQAGFWLVMTTVLWVVSFRIAVRLYYNRQLAPAEKAVFFCGITHALFVLFVFGPPTAWAYDFNLLIIGGAAVISAAGVWRGLAWVLIVSALLGCYTQAGSTIQTWHKWARVPGTPGLYASATQTADWVRLTTIAGKQRVFVFNYLGGVGILDSRLRAPASWCLYWWNAPLIEIDRTRDELRQAEVVIIPRYLDRDMLRTHPANGPVFREDLKMLPVVEEWPSYRVLRRLGTNEERFPVGAP